MLVVRTGSWTGPPRGKRDPRVGAVARFLHPVIAILMITHKKAAAFKLSGYEVTTRVL